MWNETAVDQVPLWSIEELIDAGKKIKTKRAPGPDGISPEMVRAVIGASGEWCLGVLNKLLRGGIFPEKWKVARLDLIEKPAKHPGAPVAFRPICLIGCFGKLFEQLINRKLMEELEQKQALRDFQYGFRPGRSTVGALGRVQEIADWVNRGAYGRRQFCVLVTLDVRNAFNSITWKAIVKALKSRGVNSYLVRMIESCLSHRCLRISPDRTINITRRVPQGSVLGPTPWNVCYDSVLKIKTPKQVNLIAYAGHT